MPRLRSWAVGSILLLSLATALASSSRPVDISKLPDLEKHLKLVKAYGDSIIAEGIPTNIVRPPLVKKEDYVVQEDPSSSRQKRASGCDPGWTGSNCESPICYNFTQDVLHHDGRAKLGDLVELDYSPMCTDTLTFYLDNFMNTFYITIQMPNGGTKPNAIVLDLQGSIVPPCATFPSDGQTIIHQYCDHASGLHRIMLSAVINGLCTIHVNAPTALTIDGGFVEDPRDDDAQFFYPKPNEAIYRNPRQGVPAYLVFWQGENYYPVHTTTLHIYENTRWNTQYNLVYRYSCAFPMMTASSFNCPSLLQFYIKFIGFDNGGNTWQRIYSFTCDANPIT